MIAKNCELVVRQEGLKVQILAKGPLPVLAALVIVICLLLRPG